MKRVYRLLLSLLVIGALALLGLAFFQHKGYVLFAYKGFRYESSLWAFVVLVLLACLLIWLLRLAIRATLTSLGLINPWSGLHRARRIRNASANGFQELIEGRWAKAQSHLLSIARSESQPLIHYLGAARAASHLEQYEQSDALLAEALQRQPQAELAIALTHAELQQSRNQLDAASETLQVMLERYPRNLQLLRQLQQVQVLRGDWQALLQLLPALRKDKALPAEQLIALERQAWSEYLHRLPVQDADQATLAKTWAALSPSLHNEAELLALYAERLRRLDATSVAEELLRRALNHAYDSRLARLYGLIHGPDVTRQLQYAEGWLKQHPEDPALLLTLGRLCLCNQLWGKARGYFESSLSFEKHPETCAELARLLAQLGEVERSNALFQQGLGLLDQRLGGSA